MEIHKQDSSKHLIQMEINSHIRVYKYIHRTGMDDYTAPSMWRLEWTYSLRESAYVSNMVSLTTGDFNRDGIDDLAVTWVYYYGPQDNRGSTAVVLFGNSTRMLQRSHEFPLNFGSSNIVRGAFTYGDLLGSGSNVLILGGQLDDDSKAGELNSRYMSVYSWDGSSFVSNDAQPVGALSHTNV